MKEILEYLESRATNEANYREERSYLFETTTEFNATNIEHIKYLINEYFDCLEYEDLELAKNFATIIDYLLDCSIE